MEILITGGCGFIGSHLCENLYEKGHRLRILDNFSSGSRKNIEHLLKRDAFKGEVKLFEGDCTNSQDVKNALKNVDVVFHFAANPEVRLDICDPKTCFRENVYATYVLLEELRNDPKIHTILFASTSTVYGDAEVTPTPEDYSPLKPISLYGACKLSSEAIITAYAYNYNKNAIILRLANVIGARSRHGVIFDFIKKLEKDPSNLEILGDGTQTKSYLYIDDCVDAIETTWNRTCTKGNRVEIYNIGSESQITVSQIAEIVIKEMDLKKVNMTYTGGVDGGRGWKGDVKNMFLDITKLATKGWKPKLNSAEAVTKAAREIIKETY